MNYSLIRHILDIYYQEPMSPQRAPLGSSWAPDIINFFTNLHLMYMYMVTACDLSTYSTRINNIKSLLITKLVG